MEKSHSEMGVNSENRASPSYQPSINGATPHLVQRHGAGHLQQLSPLAFNLLHPGYGGHLWDQPLMMMGSAIYHQIIISKSGDKI